MKDNIRVGVIGVGNCFAGLMQGIELYRTKLKGAKVIGLMNEEIDGYTVENIDFVAAWDVGEDKIGGPLTEAVYEEPNLVRWLRDADTSEWWLSHQDVIVGQSPILDGIGIYVANKIKPLENEKTQEQLYNEAVKTIKDAGVEILVNYLPVGSQKATEFWAQVALDTKCAFVNCIPVFIASDENHDQPQNWLSKFKNAGVPIIGDDVKGQIGATIVHRVLTHLVSDRGAKLEKTYQLNVGGNTDFLNMKEQERLESKKISKTESVVSQLEQEFDTENVHIGPSDFIPFLGNTKIAFIRLEGKSFAEKPFSVEVRLEVDDKSMSAGVVIDAIRLAKVALDRNEGGVLTEASAYLMKHPPLQMSDATALSALHEYLISET